MTTMPRPIYETKEDKDIDLAHLFDTFINNRMLILGITGFFAALGIAYALLATPVYLASAMMMLALAAQDFIFPDSHPGHLRFKHVITRDVVYEATGLHERQALHRHISVALAARVGEALGLAGVVVGDPGEGLAGDHRLAGRLLDQRVVGVDAELLHVGTRGQDVDDDLLVGARQRDAELVRRRGAARAALHVENEIVADLVGDARQRGAVRHARDHDVDRGHTGLEPRPAGQRPLAIQRLEAAAEHRRQSERAHQTGGLQHRCAAVRRPHSRSFAGRR